MLFGTSSINVKGFISSSWANLPNLRLRNTRESTPCSLIKDSDTIRSTPGSTTRPASSHEINQRIESSSRRNIPTSNEMNQFFATAEKQEQTQFIEKYNFDPVSEKPLPGRYEWVKLDP